MTDLRFLAVDLGAQSGRVVEAAISASGLQLSILHRFANESRRVDGHLRWDTNSLLRGIEAGLARASKGAVSVGVDTWGVDYAWIDSHGRLLAEPVCYRDPRTDGEVERVLARVPAADLFASTGLQIQAFNTLYQLHAELRTGSVPAKAQGFLMMPDLVHHHLCGARSGEYSNATTTQLVDASSRSWDLGLCARLAIPGEYLPELVEPGTKLGTLRSQFAASPELAVVAPATHDTASAIAGTPLEGAQAYLSSGTWSLLGVELDEPLLNAEVAAQNLTNEGGVGGRIRLLKNIMGLWIFEQCRKSWREAGALIPYDELQRRMCSIDSPLGSIDPDAPRFFNPDDMVEAVRSYLRDTGQEDSSDQVLLSRIILDSLARRYADTIDGLERATGQRITALRVIGGGAQNTYLNQATADAIGRPVIAGPIEATAIGNVLVQAMSRGVFANLDEARGFLRETLRFERFEARATS